MAAFFCIGLYKAAEGEHEIAPDGRKIKVWGMILYPIKYFLQKYSVKRVYYTQLTVDDLLLSLKIWFPNNELLIDKRNGVIYAVGANEWRKCGYELKEKYFIEIRIYDDNRLEIWKEYSKFRYLSNPIIGCYKCYPSFWGTIIFWFGAHIATYTEYIDFDYEVLTPMWVMFIFCLIPLNILLYKLVKE